MEINRNINPLHDISSTLRIVQPIRSKYISNLYNPPDCSFYQQNVLSTYPSKILEEAVREFSRLPGIGSRSALRLVLHLLKENPQDVDRLGTTVSRLRKEIR